MSGFFEKPSRCASAGAARKPHLGWLLSFSSAGPQNAGFDDTGNPVTGLPFPSHA